jgi:hypothetical protein
LPLGTFDLVDGLLLLVQFADLLEDLAHVELASVLDEIEF